ncbi:Dihydrosphingosine phosphate lyase, partial [Coemansia sp. RSA 2611]
MTNAMSTLARVDWQRITAYTINNPRQAFINAAVAYFVLRQVAKGVKTVTIYGLQHVLSALWRTVAGGLIRHVRRTPGAGAVVQRNIAKAIKDIENSMNIDIPGETKFVSIPEHPMSDEEILAVLERRQNEAGVDWKNGRASGAVYHGGEELARLTNQAYAMFNLSNPLHPGVFPGLRRLEAEVVRMVLNLYNGSSECCGTTTSGGTESIIMAVRAHVVWGRKTRGIERPNIVVPITAHAAFDKAAEYFDIGITHVPVDQKTQRVEVKALERAIDSDTVLIVGSSATYPH